MLKKQTEMVGFLLENFYLSTNAVGVVIIDSIGNIAAECGHIDSMAVSELTRNIAQNSQKLFKNFTGVERDNIFMVIKGNRGSMAVASVGDNFYAAAFYPKVVDIFSISDNIQKFIKDIAGILSSARDACLS
ncbi:MAG: hypothetical protein V1647_00765 [Pseudomonadota bacterium]